MSLDSSFGNDVIKNMSTLRENVQLSLVNIMKISVELLVGSVINVTTKVITNCTVPYTWFSIFWGMNCAIVLIAL